MSGTNLFASETSTLDIALTDENGLAVVAKCTGVPPTTANIFQHGCLIIRTDSGAGVDAQYQNTGSSAVPVWTLLTTALGGSATSLVDSNSNSTVLSGATATAVNQLTVTNSATGAVSANAVQLTATGTDAAVSLSMAPKGATGILTLGLATGTGDIVLGSSSTTQTVKIGNGAGVPTVNIANVSTGGSTINISTAAITNSSDTINLATGNAVGTGIKAVNILTGTPGTAGNNRLTMGGSVAASAVTVKAALTHYRSANYIATEGGANNAITGTLTDASGANVPLVAGLRVAVKLAHTLQAGANTFDFNGGGAVAIKSHNNAATDIGTVYAATGIIELMYNDTAWLDMSQ